MGSPKHLRKLYEKPKKLWDTARITEERGLATEYGLRSMHELWRMKTILRKIRRNARQLLSHTGTAANESEKQLLARAKGFLIRGETATLDDILALTTKDILERRLQTQVVRRGFAKTMRQARQLITHGHIQVGSQKATSPAYLVKFNEEQQINWRGKPVTVQETKAEEPEPEAETAETKPDEEAKPETEKAKPESEVTKVVPDA
ncbi:MAG: 30S ribosomal protein S4 [Candidatus Micrarchaeota archaeon]